ncbi:MAG: response regulator transcription factor [Chloroflexota bacterium]
MKALVVDDDRVLADLVSFALRREGYQVVQAGDGPNALLRWQEDLPDIILLDVNLPKTIPPLDGFAILRKIRESSAVPVILLTVRAEEDDIVNGLKLGADDYIAKPFSPRQLVARVEAVMRRSGRLAAPALQQVGGLALDAERREARIDGGPPLALTVLECRLLDYLMANAGHILTNAGLIDHIWGPGGGDRDMLRQLVRRLRSKIEPDPAQPRFIETVPGQGYGLRK